MKKKEICVNCNYSRSPGALDFDIPGVGNWCSNSQSPRWRTRVGGNDTCLRFYQRGKKAPLGLRLKVVGLGWLNKLLSWFVTFRQKK